MQVVRLVVMPAVKVFELWWLKNNQTVIPYPL
jgi:hypothetical protein